MMYLSNDLLKYLCQNSFDIQLVFFLFSVSQVGSAHMVQERTNHIASLHSLLGKVARVVCLCAVHQC